MTGLEELRDMERSYKILKYPSFAATGRESYLALTKWSDKTANNLTQAVIAFLKFKGHQAERISNTGSRMDNTKVVTTVTGFRQLVGSAQWIPGTGTKGTADISATIKPDHLTYGVSVKIEVKIGRDRQSDDQKKYESVITSAGGVYLIATNFQSFYEWYYDFIKTK